MIRPVIARRLRLPVLSLLAAMTFCACQEPGESGISNGKIAAGKNAQGEILPRNAQITLNQLKPKLGKPENKPYKLALSEEAKNYLAQSEALLKKKDYSAAIEKALAARAVDPGNPDTNLLLGQAYLMLPNYNEARQCFQATSVYYSDDVKLQVHLGRLAYLQKNYDEALRRFRLALLCSNARPNNSQTAFALLFLGKMLEKRGYWQASLECFNQLNDYIAQYRHDYKDDEALRELILRPETFLAARGRLLFLLHQNDEAVRLLDRAYRLDRSQTSTAQHLLAAMIDAGQYARAEKFAIELIREDPNDAIMKMVGVLCAESADKAMPMRIWDSHREKNNISPRLGLALAVAAERVGAQENSIAILRSLLHEVPDNIPAVRLMARLLAGRGRHQQALELMARLICQNSKSAEIIRDGVRALAKSNPPAGLSNDFAKQADLMSGRDAYAFHYVAGLIAELSGLQSLAQEQYRLCLKDRSDFYPACEALVLSYLATGRPNQIEELLQHTAEQSDKSASYYYFLGRTRLKQGRLEDAILALTQGRRKNASHLPTIVELAEAYRQKASQYQPDSPDARRNYAMAAVNLKTALKVRQELKLYYRLFKLYVRQGDFRSALDVAENLIKDAPDRPDGIVLAADACLLQGDSEKTQEYILELARKFPSNIQISLLRIRLECSPYGKIPPKAVFERAVRQLGKLLVQTPEDVQARRLLAQLISLPIVGKYSQAATLWKNLYEQTHEDEYGKACALALYKAGHYSRAIKLCRELLRNNRNDDMLRKLLVELLLKNKQNDQALQQAQQYRQQQATAESFELLLKTRIALKQYPQALEQLDETAPEIPANGDGYKTYHKTRILVLAAMYEQLRDWLGAEKNDLAVGQAMYQLVEAKQYLQALELIDALAGQKNPAFDKFLSPLRIRCLVHLGRTNEAIKFTNDLVKKNPEYLFAREELINSLNLLEQTEKSLEILRGWIRQFRKSKKSSEVSTDVLNNLRGMQLTTLLLAGEGQQALKLGKQYVADCPDAPHLLDAWASVLAELGKRSEATGVLERAQSLAKNDPSLANNLAYSLAEMGKDLDRAEKLTLQALAKAGMVEAFMDTLGWVYYKKGEFSKAGEIFLTMLPDPSADDTEGSDEQQPQFPSVIWDHAGDTFYRLGWGDRALMYWKASLKALSDKDQDAESLQVRRHTPAKIQAVESNRSVNLSPLGGESK